MTAALVTGGQEHAFVQEEERSTTEPLNGASCTETSFSLDSETAAGSGQLKLILSLDSENTMTLYDYGLAMI